MNRIKLFCINCANRFVKFVNDNEIYWKWKRVHTQQLCTDVVNAAPVLVAMVLGIWILSRVL
ncbi:hypothetical protein C4577_06430 [Candidatus Parcubacteria bacterium]|nr:MAG: hypothetical protein C4577_06430 [Candidatus Parcubacteria bacterium]